MNLIGDFERLFATNLYPLRVPIAVALVISLVAIAIVARRRGWFGSARRHPRRSGAGLVLVLAVALPTAWYLASPLFIRTQLIEPGPVAADAVSPASPAQTAAPAVAAPAHATSSPSAAEQPVATTAEPSAFVPVIVAAGSFHGADDFHFGEGTATIVETSSGQFTLRFEQFSVRNGPDLYVYLSPERSGYANGVIELGSLKATDGSFGYELPAGSDPTDYASAVVWCKQFAVLFAVAPFKAA